MGKSVSGSHYKNARLHALCNAVICQQDKHQGEQEILFI
jgi:hypothetical protein